MILSREDYEIGAFFLLIAIFSLWERLRPARNIDRWAEFKLDVLSFAFALLVNRLCTYSVTHFATSISPTFVVDWVRALQTLPSAAKIVIGIFMVDFVIYWIHRAQHNTSLLWRTHAWHHSVQQMYWFSGFRTSFFHSFLYNIPQTCIPIWFLALSPLEAGVGYSIGLLIQFWEHTNIKVNIGPLRWIIITPQYHRVHHSATEHSRMNLGTTFSIWDRMFGTYVDPETMPEEFPLGLGEEVPLKKVPRMMMGV
jgi:sterol desaturase/sphingolipid hydroxylase (fatty acid hydroxylase superfamily)